ncbi:MAG: Cell envelope-associated transcriptional attenuator LytR-CpsA-Psr, subfamily A1 [uncultured Nocardioidaceae bacterium]|uniref:Cell envelope-associated transcriptional attenuator LytR-CpsA-Psr, subfamily A1 n=1 Tax=uncultured Nocardioidaceae bacterium TaxID=253824 RepID=A0A6J4NC25_9ACTN|nr:MAG: Cell envelope-associated transcriptional attenuator LytR-CpsA-Psr, subfamily A1 [uncultured Nocardioidaceae bacterium]
MSGGRGPSGSGRSGSGDEDYNWLYGSGGAAGGRGDGPAGSTGRPEDPDSTRVMPSLPQSGRDAPRRSDPPPSRIAPGPTGPPPSARRPPSTGRSGPRFRLRWLWLLLLAYVVFLVAVPVYAWMKVSSVDAEPSGDRPADQPGTTYLLVGSDAREELSGDRTDTIMLLHTGGGPPLLMSIPRDSIVEIPGEGTNKINAAYAFGGPELLIQTIEGSTGIRVDHFVKIGFEGLVNLVDAVGGIEICPESAIDDPLAKIDIEKGCQEADGETALGYARSRKSQSLGDIDRARHQREVVSAIGSEVLNWRTVVNPVRYWRVMTGGASAVEVSDGTGPLSAARFAYSMTRVDGDGGLTCGVPIADLEVNWDQERAEQLFDLIAEDRTDEVSGDLCTPSGMPQ